MYLRKLFFNLITRYSCFYWE